MTMLRFADLVDGQELKPLVKPAVSKVQLVKYAGASGDYNLLHTDDAFARSMGLPGAIAHGMLVMGFLGEYIQQLAGVTARVAKFNMRFGAMTKPGDEITCAATVKRVYEDEGKKYVEFELQAAKSIKEIVGSGSALLEFFE